MSFGRLSESLHGGGAAGCLSFLNPALETLPSRWEVDAGRSSLRKADSDVSSCPLLVSIAFGTTNC